MVTAAFFDIDGTLYREGMITGIFKKLIKSDIIDEELWYKDVLEKYNLWDRREGNYDDYLLRMAEIYIEAIKGLHKSQIDFIAKKLIEQNGDRVYKYTRDKIDWHREQGHKVITISGSPSELVAEMSKKFKVDDYIGTEYTKDSHQCFTGEFLPMWDSESKQKAVAKFVEKYDIDLDSSYAYGDTAGDFLMLKAVKNPHAINPTKELISMIQEDKILIEKTKVVVERKDMIYELCANAIQIDCK